MIALLSLMPVHGDQARAKLSVSTRVGAKMIDIVLVMLLAAFLPYPLGSLLAFLYSLFADGFDFQLSKRALRFKGQSLGKKLLGLRVINVKSGHPASFKDSALRNAPVGVATFFAIIPVWGWLILGLIGIPLMVMEVYLMLSVVTGHRLGDVMGDTEVVEFK